MAQTANPKIKRALVSVSDKEGIVDFCSSLSDDFGIEIISTGGTLKTLLEAGINAIDISKYTGFPEMMDGRVKTLHPKVHGGILARRDIDQQVMLENEIKAIDLVIVNLYPFIETIAKEKTTLETAIENIDIGGPSMVRSAAKNNLYSTGVTTNGTPGSSGAYTQIAVTTATPQRIYYQCSSHELMGNLARTYSTAFADTTSSAILTITGGSITDSSGAISFGNENLSTSGTLTLSSLSAASSDTDAFIVSDSGVLKTRTGAQVASDIGAATNAFAIAQAVALG